MRCWSCGEHLDKPTDVCPRCLAHISPAALHRHLKITFVYALLAIVLVALFTFLVLSWHDAQFPR